MNFTFTEYTDKVVEYLEYLGYPDYVADFKVEDVAYAMHATIKTHYTFSLSYRFCAIVIFSLTLNYQVIPYANSLTKQ